VIAITGRQALAGQKKANDKAVPAASTKPPKPSPEQAQKPSKKVVSTSIPERQADVPQKQLKQKPAEPNASLRTGHRQIKASKKIAPKAEVRPRVDLTHHGLLEDSQRYDPRPNSHTAGVPHPGTSELIYEHFQELDRNQDGKVDPIERAFGRLDIDRDLQNSQPQ
jgi:hypothetical protein